MNNIRGDDDHGPRLDQLAGEFITTDGHAAHRGDRRIEPVRLVDHRTGQNQSIRQPVSRPAAMNVRIFARISASESDAPVSGSAASSRKVRISLGALSGSEAIRARRVEMIVSIADSKTRSAGRSFQRAGRGIKSGTPNISNGSIRPIVSK